MNWLWNWGSECFGYREGDNLWTYDGKHVGKFHGDDVYGNDGGYLGEVMNSNRLITNRGKQSWRQASFSSSERRARYAQYANYAGNAMYAGHEDFPSPNGFQNGHHEP